MEPVELAKLKEVEYYSASVTAWFNTMLEHDKSLLAISAAGIGLLTTLMSAFGISSVELLLLYIFALISFLVCLISVLLIFKRNNVHIQQVLSGNEQNSNVLSALDNTALLSFGLAVLFSVIIGITTAIKSYSTKEKSMSNDDVKKPSPTAFVGDSVNGFAGLNPALESFNNMQALQKSFVNMSQLQPQNTQPSQTQAQSSQSQTTTGSNQK
jgi:hypothetical protein